MINTLRKLCKDDQGQDIVEYALILAGILLLALAAAQAIGTNANTIFDSASDALINSKDHRGRDPH